MSILSTKQINAVAFNQGNEVNVKSVDVEIISPSKLRV